MATRNKVITFPASKNTAYNAVTDREMNYIGKRIAEARNQAGLSLVDFKKVLEHYGVSVSTTAINKWELGGSSPNAYQLLAIGQALGVEPDFSFFMSTGKQPELNREGLRKVAEYKADLIASGQYKPRAAVIRYIDMPVSSLSVSAGSGAFLDEGNFEMVSFPENTVPKGADFGVRVSGDSMEPVYHDGQIIWVQQCERVNVGEVGVFIYDGEGYLKIYDEQEPGAADKDMFIDSYGVLHMQPVMLSYNQKYDPRVISAHAGFQIIGRVL